jgi:hypothetical protein
MRANRAVVFFGAMILALIFAGIAFAQSPSMRRPVSVKVVLVFLFS